MRRGFTLLEMLIVISIISILVGMGTVSYSSLTKSSRDGKRKADLEQIRAALEMYRSSNSSYPTAANCSVLDPLIDAYLPTFPSDPKASSYSYNCSSSASDYTLGVYFEASTPTCSISLGCGGTVACNYCVGPYGQKP